MTGMQNAVCLLRFGIKKCLGEMSGVVFHGVKIPEPITPCPNVVSISDRSSVLDAARDMISFVRGFKDQQTKLFATIESLKGVIEKLQKQNDVLIAELFDEEHLDETIEILARVQFLAEEQ